MLFTKDVTLYITKESEERKKWNEPIPLKKKDLILITYTVAFSFFLNRANESVNVFKLLNFFNIIAIFNLLLLALINISEVRIPNLVNFVLLNELGIFLSGFFNWFFIM